MEELSLDHEACRQEEDDDENLPFASFTRLRKLRITLHVQYFVPLFRHLLIVSEVEEIDLKLVEHRGDTAGYEYMEDYEDHRSSVLETVFSWFNDVVSPRTVQCIEVCPAPAMIGRGMKMKYVRKSDSIRHPTLPHHSCFVGLRFEWPFELSAFLALETLRNATRLEVFYSKLSASQHLGIFEMVPALQELVTWAGRDCNSLRALFSTTQDSREDVQDSLCLSHVPLRNLSYLRIIEADLRIKGNGSSNEVVILNLVRRRKLLGFGLKRLELVCCQYVSPGWVDELRRFVPDTFWDGEGEVGVDDSDGDYCSSSCDLGDPFGSRHFLGRRRGS